MREQDLAREYARQNDDVRQWYVLNRTISPTTGLSNATIETVDRTATRPDYTEHTAIDLPRIPELLGSAAAPPLRRTENCRSAYRGGWPRKRREHSVETHLPKQGRMAAARVGGLRGSAKTGELASRAYPETISGRSAS